MIWYKFEFTEKQLDEGEPVKIREMLDESIKEERKHMKNSPLPKFHRSKVDDNIFFLETVGWDIEKDIVYKYGGLPREERFLPPLEEFY
jgi:hypothetical protein